MSKTPCCILRGEFGIAGAITLLARPLRRAPWTGAVALGTAGGLAIFICYPLAYAITVKHCLSLACARRPGPLTVRS
jgi:hypothetical protein